jgi:phosphoadenosine phosphosulfate reductase
VRGLSATVETRLQGATAEQVLAYAVEHYQPRLTLACSFQKEESVLFHMLSEIEGGRDVRAFTIDTGVLFPETLATWTRFRREQATTRSAAAKFEHDERRGIVKFNPLADWTEKDVWAYIFKHDLPYNLLHDQGYDSIGCTPCTLPGNGRDGRWAGLDKTECGIHVA